MHIFVYFCDCLSHELVGVEYLGLKWQLKLINLLMACLVGGSRETS